MSLITPNSLFPSLKTRFFFFSEKTGILKSSSIHFFLHVSAYVLVRFNTDG